MENDIDMYVYDIVENCKNNTIFICYIKKIMV